MTRWTWPLALGLALIGFTPLGGGPSGFAPRGPVLMGAAEASPRERVEQVRYHMGTLWTVEAEGPGSHEAMEAAFAEIGRLDRLLSTYKDDSELSGLNREGARGWVAVSAETRELVARALGFAAASDGAFDPTVGPLVKLWGFKYMDYRFPADAAIAKAKQHTGYREVEVDSKRGIRFRRAGLEVELGAIAKGYAVDRAVEILKRHGMTTARVDAGGNQRVWGPPAEGERWVFGVRHPRRDGDVLGWTTIENAGISTSGDAERGFWKDGVRYGHVIDPRTGRPAAGVLSVTVVSPDAETADALSTALYVLGPEAGSRMLARYPGSEALWVAPDGTVRPSRGFPWQPAEAEGVLH